MLLRLGRGLAPGGSGATPPPPDPEAASYFAEVAAAGGSLNAGERAAIDAFVTGCKAAGLWAKLLDVAPLAGDGLAAATVKLKAFAGAPAQLTNNNFIAGDYDRALGLTGDGATKYLGTGVLADALPLDDFSCGAFITATPPGVSSSASVTDFAGEAASRITLREFAGAASTPLLNFDIYGVSGGDGRVSGDVATALGFSQGGWDGTARKVFRDGVKLAETTGAVGAPPNAEMCFLGGLAFHSPRTLAFAYLGQSLSDGEAAVLAGLVLDLQRQLGRST